MCLQNAHTPKVMTTSAAQVKRNAEHPTNQGHVQHMWPQKLVRRLEYTLRCVAMQAYAQIGAPVANRQQAAECSRHAAHARCVKIRVLTAAQLQISPTHNHVTCEGAAVARNFPETSLGQAAHVSIAAPV
jgi:hypothetical protein